MYTPVIAAGIQDAQNEISGYKMHQASENPHVAVRLHDRSSLLGDEVMDHFIRTNLRQSSLFEFISGNSRLGSVDAHVAYLHDQRESLAASLV